MVDDAIGTLGRAEGHELGDDFGNGIGFGPDGTCARAATEGAEAAFHPLLLAGQTFHEGLLDGNEAISTNEHLARLSKVERHDGNVLEMDVMPHIELRPVGEGKDTNAFARIDAGVVKVPQLW